jgi:hypothetical protein
MALDATKVRVGVTGGAYVAPLGTTLPTDATSALNGAFVELGYINENGVTETQNISTNKIKAWQNGDIVRTVQTQHDLEYKFTPLESNASVLAQVYPSGQITGAQRGNAEWVFNVVDGVNKIRVVLPNAQITDIGDVNYVNGDAIDYPLTITAYPDASGVKAYIYRA